MFTADDQFAASLTAAMAAGNSEAVADFYQKYFDRLYAEARRCTRRDEAFCLDVMQESVLRIIRTVRRVKSERQLVAWLQLVVRTTSYDLLRSDRRRQQREAAFVAAAAPLPESRLEREEILDWLRRQLDSLDPQIARILDLRFQQRWTLARIADRFGLSTGTIDGRLRRALARLKAAAEEDFDE